MKKLTLSLMALAMVLTLAQCKKNEPEGDCIVPITLDVQAKGDGSKINVDPNTGSVGFEQNDVVYVGSGGKYVGTLTCRGTKFMGNLTNPVEGEPLYFYFLGNKFIYEDDFTPGVSTTASVDIIDQRDPDNLPVISSAVSDQDFTGEGTYTAYFRNKGALVMFNVETASSDATVIERPGLKNFVTVNFATNTFTFTDSNDQIVLPPGSGERWAIMLPQSAIPAGGQGSASSMFSTYDGTCGAIPAIVANGYYFEGIPVSVTHWTGIGVLDPPTAPTNVHSSVKGSSVLVEWNNNYAASYYKIYRSSTENGEYTLMGQTSGIAWYDNEPLENNYYKLTCGNDGGESDFSEVTYCHYAPQAPLAAPTNITATVSGSTVVLTWNSVEGAESYLVYRSATADGTFYVIGASTTTSFTDQGPGSDNYYRLTAMNSAGQSPDSDIVYCAFSGSVPATPTDVTSIISQYYNAATISWSSSAGASSYKIYKSSTKNGSYSLIGTTSQTSFVENNLQTNNFYKVSAANSWGESEKSDWTYSYYTATPSPTGAINGKFSTSANSQVYFSQGNLMYKSLNQRLAFPK